MSSTRIMADNTDPTPFENHWSIVTFALGSPVIYDIPISFASRKALSSKLLVTHYGESINLRTVVIQLLLAYFYGNKHTELRDNGNLLYNYDQIVNRNYYLRTKFGSRLSIKIFYYRLLIRFPRLTRWVLTRLRNPMLHVGHQDRYERV
jgi:hypothetical protein